MFGNIFVYQFSYLRVSICHLLFMSHYATLQYLKYLSLFLRLSLSLSQVTFWLSISVIVLPVGAGQCDQIWRKFATSANFHECFEILCGFIMYLAKFWSYFVQFSMILGKILLLYIEKIKHRAIWSTLFWIRKTRHLFLTSLPIL